MTPQKIVTCCYCGTKAALVLRGEKHHELSCSNCGAPLQAMKMLPKRSEKRPKPASYTDEIDPFFGREAKVRKQKKPKKKKSFKKKLWGEFWDAIEDIID